MADVTIKYKDHVIAEMNTAGTKTLTTSGCYCEDDIEVTYTPSSSGASEVNYRMYELTISKSSGWILLKELEDDVLTHINDARFTASLIILDEYAYEYYAGNFYVVSNTSYGISNGYPHYGYANRVLSENTANIAPIYYPANNTGTSTGLGGNAAFRIDGNKYYLKPTDGFIRGGTYRLIFTW